MNKKLTTSAVASLLLATNLYSIENLSEITVTSATKSEQSIKDVTSNVSVITKEEIEERHFTTVAEALNTLPGINLVSNGGLGKSTSVYVRGVDSEKVLVLIDGVRFNDVSNFTGGADFANLNINNIEQIEVIKGAQSGLWGADATAGVINIITKKPQDGFSGNINVEFGSFQTKKTNTVLSYGTKKYFVEAFLNTIETDGFTAYAADNTDIDNYEKDGFESLEYGLRTKYNINDSNSIGFSHKIIDSEVELDNFGSDSLTNKSKYNYTISSVNYENIYNDIKTKAFMNRTVYDWSYISSSRSDYDGSLNDFGLESTIPYLNKNSFLVVGANFKEFEKKNSINKNYNNKAVFITNSNKFNNNKTIFTQSLRYDYFNKFENKTTGKVGLKHFITNDLSASANYGTAYNVPTVTRLYHPTFGNENLVPESSKSFDLTVDYKGFGVTYFETKIKDLIGWNSGYSNIDGTSTIKGYEASYKKDVIDDLLLGVNYTHLNAKDATGKDLARRAKNLVNLSLDYYGIEKTHINLSGQYVGTRYNSSNKGGAQTGRYTVWNTVINHEINNDLKAYFKVDNVFDKYYQIADGYATSPRAFYVGLNYKF